MHRSLRIASGSLDSNNVTAVLPKSGSYEGKIAGLYDLEETLGRGHFAVVKLARHVFTGEKVAVKVIDKTKLDEVSKAHLFQEVRCMKLVQHPNVVRLYEVIDTATKLYLVLELGDGGDLYDYIMRHDTGLSEQLARDYFRQIVKAISYCHQLHVVHRDLKPENVVFFEKLGIVKLTDFGFSNKFYPGQKLETSCGSLAYSAPEILLGDSYDAPAVDVWSLGVILYMLVCGQAPFQEANDSETLTMIMDCKYNVPPHVSKGCKDLIGRMLVRNPEKRATLSEIANHQWLVANEKSNSVSDTVPLVSQEQLTEEDHNLIIQKIVNGKIATKEEIQDCLDKNEYNHITATYYLLAERKLRSKRQDQINKNKRPEFLVVPPNSAASRRDNNGATISPCLLSIPRTPGDVPQRSRKCSIVQEDEEEEDISNCSGREELVPPLNRRGSRSEGRLNLALQERLAESERTKPLLEKLDSQRVLIPLKELKENKDAVNICKSPPLTHSQHKTKLDKCFSLTESPVKTQIINEMRTKPENTLTTTLADSSTISIPILITNSSKAIENAAKYKTMPSPSTEWTRASDHQLDELFEKGSGSQNRRLNSHQIVNRNQQQRTSYEQRRSKFHKTRTASYSSSDASDDDSEKRKKRGSKYTSPVTKPFQGRRDSHDDSSDSQEPGNGVGSGNNDHATGNLVTHNSNTRHSEKNRGSSSGTSNQTGGRKNNVHTSILFSNNKHKGCRRRNGETRLRESQSLNRITEVQEDGTHVVLIATCIAGEHEVTTPNLRGTSLSAKILQGFSIAAKNTKLGCNNKEKCSHVSRKDATKSLECLEESSNKFKKVRIMGRYFQVHKKLGGISIPGIFTKNRLYKAQSCSSLVNQKVNAKDPFKNQQRAVSGVVRDRRADINQNKSSVVQLNNVCTELTGICAAHLEQASKCCSFC